jgi:DNA polymerase III subunit beta
MIVLKAAQEKVLSAFQAVCGIVEKKHTVAILSNVLIRKTGISLELITNDLEIQIQTKAELGGDSEKFTTTINARKILDILRVLPQEQNVSISEKENKITLQAGKSKFVLQTMPGENFPLIKESEKWGENFLLPQKTLKTLLNQVHFAMAVHDIRYYLNGILFVAEGKKLTIVATDGHRLALAEAILDVDIPKQEVILPRKTVLELMRLLKDNEETIEICFAENQAKFNFNGISFITKLIEGKFPDYNRVIPKNNSNAIMLDRSEFLLSLQRSAVLANEKFKGVRINIETGSLQIDSTNSEQEEAIEKLEIAYTGDSVEIGFNVIYLLDALANIEAKELKFEFQDNNTTVLITTPELSGFKYVVMPMRI